MTDFRSGDQAAPRCDVVVVNYNAGDFLARCVESVLSSNIPVSLIVVDNASSDRSVDTIRELDAGPHQFQIIENAGNYGFSKAVNIGAEQGQAPYVLLLNPDCEIYPHTIANLLSEVHKCEEFGILGALVFNENGTEQRGCRRLEPTFKRSVVTALRLGKHFQSVNLQYDPLPDGVQSLDAVSGSVMLIDRQEFAALGGMDEGYFLHVEDLDICRRMREHGRKVYFTPNVSVFHHHGASSQGVPYKTEWYKHQGMLRYQEKFQKPHQNAIRSFLTRGVIYLNLGLSVLRQQLLRRRGNEPRVQRLIDPEKSILVTGASSDLGTSILRELSNKPSIIAVSRSSRFPAPVGSERWFSWSYFEKVPTADFPGVACWLSLSPVWAAPELAGALARFGRIPRLVALSSTSIKGKANTSNAKEQAVVRQLIEGEEALLNWAGQAGSDLTICRASMVYGGEHNQNIAFVRRFIRWFRFFPLLSEGAGLRQPVHIDDLAAAVRQLADKSGLPQNNYVLAGGEQLSYSNMITHVFVAENRTVRFWLIPQGVFKTLVDLLSWVPGLGFLNREMIVRMEQDLVYDIEPARRDFEYAPGIFRSE